MRFVSKAALGAAAIAGMLCTGSQAHAAYLSSLSVSKCLGGQVKTAGKGAAADTGCYSKDAAKPDAGKLSACLAKQTTKGPAAIAKIDAKGPDCEATGKGTQIDNDTLSFSASNDSANPSGKCDSAKQKLIGKYIAGLTGCYSKATKAGPVDSACTTKNLDKTTAALAKADAKGPDCTNPGNGGTLIAAADSYVQQETCLLDPTNPGCLTCGNGAIDAGEDCDTVGAANTCAAHSNTGPGFTCNPTTCQCACPSTVTFSGNASDPASLLDTGWTGISHRAPIIANGDVTIGLNSCAASRPCGTCNVSGPIENPLQDAGQLHTRRCSNDSSIKCLSDGACGAGTCVYYFGSNLPLAAGGVGTCVVNQFASAVTGTANVESGEAITTALLTARVYTGPTDNPCPRCSDAGGVNDGAAGGTCDSGTRIGLACDANGSVPGRPDFGKTSLDCPPAPGLLAATLPIDLSNATDPVTKTLSASSPNCGDGSGEKCLCETCNNLAATPCGSNADCTAVGATICGGKRCIGGTNDGGPCVGANPSQCPGGGICGLAGEPSKPSGCLDDSLVAGLDCSDTAPVDGEGICTQGPVTKTCSVASGHGQRACAVDGDCGGGGGTCVAGQRNCFLTGGFTGIRTGSNTLTAVGMEDAPMNDTSNPTLGAVFCVGPTTASAVNAVAGLPGPGRITIRGTAVGKP